MRLDDYMYFDIECVIDEDAKARLLEHEQRGVPERRPADLIGVQV